MKNIPTWLTEESWARDLGHWLSPPENHALLQQMLGKERIDAIDDLLPWLLRRDCVLAIWPGQPSEACMEVLRHPASPSYADAFFGFGSENWGVKIDNNRNAVVERFIWFSFTEILWVAEQGRFVLGAWFSDAFFFAGEQDLFAKIANSQAGQDAC